ncbi:MAG: helix-turn-helix transcriptional regulator [Chloroflexi bacterium]|nr:helix-turn-helix transcriptional regulator [Chloroflexota bacterium]
MVATKRARTDLRVLASAAGGTSCNVERALTIVGAKWTLVILHDLMDGPKRFGEIERLIPAASAKMLTERLRELEHHGLVTRTAFAEVPPRVEYALTKTGRTLWPIVDSLDQWGRKLKSAAG